MQSSKQFTQTMREWTALFMHRSFRDFKRFMDEVSLSASQANTLMRLYHDSSCSVSDISGQLGVTNAATSQLVDHLVQSNLVTRTEDPADRRNKQLQLTPQGKALIERGIAARSQWMGELASQLTPAQQDLIAEGLEVLISAARRLEKSAESSKNT
ncbi:MarR family transcriptional regulator [bacterium]|nr:MarR family transcriptional regulator [bacterium]